MARHFLAVTLAVVATLLMSSGCNSYSPSSPTVVTPAPVVSAPLDVTTMYTLSGVVFEMTATGPIPVEDVELYCDSCGSEFGHTSVFTDDNGFYSFGWSRNGVHPLLVSKAGYDLRSFTDTLSDGRRRINAAVSGDTRFDIELVRR